MLSSREKEPGSSGITMKSSRYYIIDLNRWRSRAAFLASVITLAAATFGIVNGLVEYAKDNIPVMELFRFFTPNANTLTAMAAAFIIPYSVEGARKKRFTYPKWVAMLHYSGTICTTLTMVFSVCLISFYDRLGKLVTVEGQAKVADTTVLTLRALEEIA